MLGVYSSGEFLDVGYKFGLTTPSSHNKDGHQTGAEFALFAFTNQVTIEENAAFPDAKSNRKYLPLGVAEEDAVSRQWMMPSTASSVRFVCPSVVVYNVLQCQADGCTAR